MVSSHDRMNAALLSGGISSSVIYSAALREAARVAGGARHILDFGSGTGQLTSLLKSVFPAAAISAADIMGRPDNLADDIVWFQGDLNVDTTIPAVSFDLVFAVEVIEHLENPRQMIREIFRILAPGGIAILKTPNVRSVKSLMTMATRGHHSLFDESNYPAHITPVSEIDFSRAGTEAGFKSVEFFYTDDGTIPKLLHTRWQAIPGVGKFFRGRSFSDNVGAILRKP